MTVARAEPVEAHPPTSSARAAVAPEALSFFRAASGYLHRQRLECPLHLVAHTGKLARVIVLDLCLHDATSEDVFWRRAIARAEYVADRLAPDPDHGGLIYLPGRFDPRNCSNSVIDSGECTDALARLLLHPRAVELPPSLAERLRHAVLGNADTYLRTAVVEKEITNQRLWGAMALATACQLEPREEWIAALRLSLERSLQEQRSDGSWGYQPDAEMYGAHPGASDLTVYYHGRCLAFIDHVLDRVPQADPDGAASRALEQGLEFLAAVTMPDGIKPLALEGKRWFWDGSYEAGSNAYDVYALLRGACRFNRAEWVETALRAWRQLTRHQQANGSIRACLEADAHDFVCPDFHTADLAWPAIVMGELSDSTTTTPQPAAGRMRTFQDAGVLRLDTSGRTAIIRTHKTPANTQFGGAVGGGSLAAVYDLQERPLLNMRREALESEASFVCRPPLTWRTQVAAARWFLRQNRPGREGRQWLFVARVLITSGDPVAAACRLWRGLVRPFFTALRDPVSSRWATSAHVEHTDGESPKVAITSTLARPDGAVPVWARTLTLHRHYHATEGRLQVAERLEAADTVALAGVTYRVPRSAEAVEVSSSGCVVERTGDGRRIVARPAGGAISLEVRYWL